MNQPIKWVGGKHYLAPTIHKLAPPHALRLIPCAGGLGELWSWPCEGVAEVVNDLDSVLVTFWHTLASPSSFSEFYRRVQCIPFSRPHWEEAKESLEKEGDDIDRAVAFFVCVRQSMMGLRKSWAPLSRKRLRRGMNEQASAWMSAVDGLPEAHERLRRVVVENLDAADFIRRYDCEQSLTYADFPYFPSTREANLYAHEMTAEKHEELLHLLLRARGKVMVSGYACPLYDDLLKGWTRVEVACKNNMTKADTKPERVEVLWMNYKPPEV